MIEVDGLKTRIEELARNNELKMNYETEMDKLGDSIITFSFHFDDVKFGKINVYEVGRHISLSLIAPSTFQSIERRVVEELILIIREWFLNHPKYRMNMLFQETQIEMDMNIADFFSIEERKKYYSHASLESLEFSVRSYNVLRYNGHRSLQDLKHLTKEKLEDYPNLGSRSIDEIIKKLAYLGYDIE